MIKLKILSLYEQILSTSLFLQLRNNYFHLALALVLASLSIIYPLALVILFLYFLFLYRQSKTICIISFILVCLFGSIYYLKDKRKLVLDDVFLAIVSEKEETSSYQKLLVLTSKTKVIVYNNSPQKYEIGDYLEIEGTLNELNPPHLPNGFDYAKYLHTHGIIGTVNSNKITKIKKPFSPFLLKYYLSLYLDKYFSLEAKNYLQGLLFGDRSGFDADFSASIIDNGLVHLFAVSGLHIGLIIAMISFIFQKLKLKKEKPFLIVFLSLYLIVTAFSPSILRAVLMYFLSLLNKKKKLHLSSLDIISLVYLLLIIINPFYLHDLGFSLSFLVATMIIVLSPLLKNFPSYQQVGIISFAGMVLVFPLTIAMNNEVNLLSFVSNILFIYLVSSIIMPAALLAFFCFFTQKIFVLLMQSFSLLSKLASKIMYLPLRLPPFSFFALVFYYLLIYLIITHYKRPTYRLLGLACLCLLIFTVSNSAKFSSYGEVIYLDLYEGEAILIKTPYQNSTILIDTGIGKNNEVTKFLLQKGIKKLDILFLTHNHEDHIGEASYLLSHINVKEVITSPYLAPAFATKQVKKGDVIKCKDLEFLILNPSLNNQDINDNSLVIYTKINNRYFLFMGDLTSKQENNLPKLTVDFLKVGHHGSNTSSSEVFLKKNSPKFAIILVGQTNKYRFPNPEVVKRLEEVGSKVYSSLDYYTITYWYQKNKEEIRTQKKPLSLTWFFTFLML